MNKLGSGVSIFGGAHIGSLLSGSWASMRTGHLGPKKSGITAEFKFTVDTTATAGEKVTNGAFATDTAWDKQAGWTIAAGAGTCDGTSGRINTDSDLGVVAGQTYVITYDVIGTSAGFVKINGSSGTGTSAFATSVNRSADGTYTEYLVATGDGRLAFYSTGFVGSIDNVSVTQTDQFTIPTTADDYVLEWFLVSDPTGTNSGGPVAVSTANHTITFPAGGIYQIAIDPVTAGVSANNFDNFRFNNGGDKLKSSSVGQWGATVWSTMDGAFYGCSNLTTTGSDIPNLSAVTNMNYMFWDAELANPAVSSWDTSAVTSMSNMFRNATAANPGVSNWDISSVTNTSSMFHSATLANPDVSNWDTSSVTNMSYMFHSATAANPNTSSWDTSLVTNMANMLRDATSWTRYSDLANWDITSVTNMANMLNGLTIPTADYNAILIAWDAQAVQTGVAFHGGSSQSSGAGATARANLIADHGWVFTDTAP